MPVNPAVEWMFLIWLQSECSPHRDTRGSPCDEHMMRLCQRLWCWDGGRGESLGAVFGGYMSFPGPTLFPDPSRCENWCEPQLLTASHQVPLSSFLLCNGLCHLKVVSKMPFQTQACELLAGHNMQSPAASARPFRKNTVRKTEPGLEVDLTWSFRSCPFFLKTVHLPSVRYRIGSFQALTLFL